MLGSHNIAAFIQITSVEKARDFYEGVLGLRFVKDDGFAAVFDANGIMVRAAKMKEFTPLQSTVLGWQVENIEEMVRALQKKGVHFEIFGFFKQDELGIWTAPTGDKVAWFKDPDGNVLSVSQHV
ncbi:MAG TPA: VOC family protein [Candidatus Sulfotelmatobacter sp.]|jgi:catechol 2,3-dioxygenase-like lactoylglutathione lyase family enzyme